MNEPKSWKVVTALAEPNIGNAVPNLESALQKLADEGYEPRWLLHPPDLRNITIIAQPKPSLELITGELMPVSPPAIDEHALRYIIEQAFKQNSTGDTIAELLFTRILAAHGAGNLLKK